MRPFFIIICTFVLLPVLSIANDAETVFSHPLTAKNQQPFAAKIKTLLIKKEQSKSFSQQKKVAALKRPLISSGILVLSPRGVCLATQAPFAATVKVTPKGIWQQTGTRKASVKSADKNFEIRHTANVLIALFTADVSQLKKQFSLFYQQTDNKFTIGLRPKNRILGKIISDIVIEGTDRIHRIGIREANGDNTTILISDDPPSKTITLETCIQ